MGKIEKVSVDLTDELLHCAKSAVDGGEFVSIQQVVDATLHDWKAKREADLRKVRSMIDDGIASGFEPWSGVDDVIAEGQRTLGERSR